LKKIINNITQVSKIVEVLIFISIFISTIVFFKVPFEGYLHYLIFLGLLPFFLVKYGYPMFLLKILGVIALAGVYNVLLDNCTPFGFIKIWGGMLLSFSFYYFVLCYYKFNLFQLFNVYLKWSYYAAIIGLIQLLTFLIGFGPGYNYSWLFNKWAVIEGGFFGIRVNSIFAEPSTLAAVLAPAVYVSVYNIFHKSDFMIKKSASLIIIACYLATSSSTAYLGVMLISFLVIDGLKIRYLFIGLALGLIGFFVFYKYSLDFQSRIDSSIALWVYEDFRIENTNTSGFVLYNNFHVGWETFKESPLIGHGVGSFELGFDKHTLTKTKLNYNFEFNTSDGNSLFIRMMGETGLLGLGSFLFLIIRGFISKGKREDLLKYRILSQALLIMILLNLLRQGNYFLNGFPFFVILYYYNWKEYKREKLKFETNIEPELIDNENSVTN